ncbi:MAG: hypothetical protein WBA10_20335 [Elainellaceae cyanobacterium]
MSHQAQIPLPFELYPPHDASDAAVTNPASEIATGPIGDSLLPHGHTFSSPGGHFTYRIIGPCCRLFDREELPWPCCRLQWHSKEPSWRRVGRRFVPDLAAKRSPSYHVEILNPEYPTEPIIITMYWIKLPAMEQQWWYTKIRATNQTP